MLCACVAAPKPGAATAECRQFYEHLDRKTDAAAARDAAAHSIPGFPYLRSNRFLASFSGELGDEPKFQAWLAELRLLDLQARAAELRNLGDHDVARTLPQLKQCSRLLAEHELNTPEWRQRLIERAQVPDDYSALARTLGVYPLAAPFLKLGINGYQKGIRADYASPLEEGQDGSPLFLWQPEPPTTSAASVATLVSNAQRDVLGVPQLSEEQWQRLAQAHAPNWWVETSGEFDLIGAPLAGSGFNPLQHVVYFLHSYTRYGNAVLPQLVYIAWFSERPAEKSPDFYAGALDGIVWRVTLDSDGVPLLYDTIHPCGCYHYYYPVKALRLTAPDDFWQEPVLVPQPSAPAQRVAIRVQSATHFVRRVVSADEAHAKKLRHYSLVSYRELLTLPDSDNRTRSLFAEDGLVVGSERGERFWLWISGISSPGAMREWGRHATAFVGRAHFDDPHFLDSLFSRAPAN